jgi:hypothetical protein
VRGGLDDALDKLARRDELRRRAEGGGIGTPPAVQDLVEAIAAVVGRNPALEVTVGVEGAGDPVLLHFAVQDGIVSVSADNALAARVAEAAPTSPRHADFDVDPDDAVPYSAAPASDTGQTTRRISYDDPAFEAYRSETYADGSPASHRRYESDGVPSSPLSGRPSYSFDEPDPFEPTRPFAGGTSHPSAGGAPHPFSGGASHPFGQPSSAFGSEATRRIYRQHRADDAPAAERAASQRIGDGRIMPTPLPEPTPLQVDTTETELAAKRLAALLRDNPSLLRRSPSD